MEGLKVETAVELESRYEVRIGMNVGFCGAKRAFITLMMHISILVNELFDQCTKLTACV